MNVRASNKFFAGDAGVIDVSGLSAEPQPRPPRLKVAVLVYNDLERDTRVRSISRAIADTEDVVVRGILKNPSPADFSDEPFDVQLKRETAIAVGLPRILGGALAILLFPRLRGSLLRRGGTSKDPLNLGRVWRGVRLGWARVRRVWRGRVWRGVRLGWARVRRPLLRSATRLRRRAFPGIAQGLAFAALHGAEIREQDPDVIHANDFPCLVAAFAVSIGRPTRIVYDSHELWPHRNAAVGGFVRLVEKRVEHRLVRSATETIVVSPSIQAWFTANYRVSEDRVHVVRNIFNSQPGEGGRKQSQPRSPSSPVVLLYLGRITTGRGLETAVAALALLEHRFVLRIVGYGPDAYVDRIKGRVRSAGVEDRVKFVGAVPPDAVVSEAARAHIALVAIDPICLSYRYSLPNKLFESVQAGLPIVASDLPDIAAVVRQYDLGCLHEPGSPADLARAVEGVEENWFRFRASVRRAASQLNWEKEQGIIHAIYGRVARRAEVVSHDSVWSGRQPKRFLGHH